MRYNEKSQLKHDSYVFGSSCGSCGTLTEISPRIDTFDRGEIESLSFGKGGVMSIGLVEIKREGGCVNQWGFDSNVDVSLRVLRRQAHSIGRKIEVRDNTLLSVVDDDLSKAMMSTRLDDIKDNASSENWDGYGALPVESASYENTKRVIKCMPCGCAEHWNLFPNTNGTIILSANDGKSASINIGNKDFSYFAIGDDGKYVKGKKEFSIDEIKNALKQIKDVLGWR